ncbi:FAD-binding oxidoreductase [Halorussus litoreus]|uniref:FAD-binding oxidoreductase n=1 Tax=Halorussus litoreus TaxID=1710536 RepID=UPI003742382A
MSFADARPDADRPTGAAEHGIGVGKQSYMLDEHGEATVETMRAVKQALDPEGILNPGKIFPE